MTHSFNLVSPNKEYSSIRLIVCHNGERFRKSVGLTVATKLWNQKAKSLDKMCKDRDTFAILAEIHAKLVEKEHKAKRRKDVLDAVSYALGEEISPVSVHLWDYFKEWSQRDMPSRRFRELAYKRIADVMGTEDDWSDIDGDWHFRFVSKMDALGYSFNYKSTLSAKFRTMMKEAYEREIHNNNAYTLFKSSYKTAETIALTQAEVDSLWRANLTGVQARARDCFIVGVYCAGRFQDYSQLSEENISDGKLRYTQRKTGAEIVIPCSSRIKMVFERNGGKCPKITEQEVGREIKKICKSLGGSFLDKVEIRSIKGDKVTIEKKLRCDMVSTHTARRSGASILYKSGVPIRLCRFLTGHTNDAQFLKYIKCSKEEGAELLAKSEFFK